MIDRSKVYGTKKEKNKGTPIQLMHLSAFINEEVSQRQLPKN